VKTKSPKYVLLLSGRRSFGNWKIEWEQRETIRHEENCCIIASIFLGSSLYKKTKLLL